MEYRKVSPAFGIEADVMLGCAITDKEMQALKIMKIRFIQNKCKQLDSKSGCFSAQKKRFLQNLWNIDGAQNLPPIRNK